MGACRPVDPAESNSRLLQAWHIQDHSCHVQDVGALPSMTLSGSTFSEALSAGYSSS